MIQMQLSEFTIEIINELGQISTKKIMNPNDQTIEMEMGHLQPGSYTVRISSQGHSSEYKIVKQ